MLIFNARAYLVTSFFPVEPKSKNTFLFPPILRNEVVAAETLEKDHILVYFNSEYHGFAKFLRHIRANFIIYGFDRDEKDGNLSYKKSSQDGFIADLASAKAVIATAGFTLISEALFLGKPYFAIPAKNQFEQTLNGYYLDKLGYGKYWDNEDVDKEKIEAFLYNIEHYKENLKQYIREDNSSLFGKIDEIITNNK
jgi:uncharacterized protein (TIGR00661 family)